MIPGARCGVPVPASDPPFWLLPNLLSLDAPIVAVVWQDFASRCAGSPLRWESRAALALTVWAIYIADRLLDIRRPPACPEAARHRFYREHRSLGMAVLGAILAVNLAVTLAWLRPAVILGGLVPFAGVAVYLASVHVGDESRRWPKEPLVALLFTVGIFLVPWTWTTRPVQSLGPPAAALFLLLLANLVAIETWEWRELRNRRESTPHITTLWLGSSLAAWAGGLSVLSVLFGGSSWYYAVALAATATVGLATLGTRIPLNARRALVDIVLLTPLLFRA